MIVILRRRYLAAAAAVLLLAGAAAVLRPGRPAAVNAAAGCRIYSPEAVTLREKKVSDLKNRVALINSKPEAVLISIHQNSMPDHPSVHGAQVFYNGAVSGPRLGETVQAALNGAVNAGNGKNAKAIDSTIYLMKNVQCPAILVECGFLSNRTETGQLLTGGYQLKLAVCIAAGFLQHDTEGASALKPKPYFTAPSAATRPPSGRDAARPAAHGTASWSRRISR